MRIRILIDRFVPEDRSQAHLYHDLARSLVARGHGVQVVTKYPAGYVGSRGRGKVPRRERVDDIDVVRVRGMAGRTPILFLRAVDQAVAPVAYSIAGRGRVDVTLVYSPPLPLSLTAVWGSMVGGVPFVVNLHDFYPRTAVELGALKNRALIAAAERLETYIYRSAAAIVVPARESMRILAARGDLPRSKLHYVPNWVDAEAVRPDPEAGARFRRNHNLGDRFVVSYAGLMGFAQDLGPTIEAARQLRDVPDLLFLLVGDGVYRERWERRAEGLENVRFLPLLPKPDYLDLLHASDVCLAPLMRDLHSPAIPGKIQSIMAAARPVVAAVNPDSGAWALVHESGCGAAVPTDDAQSLADAVMRLRDDPAERGRQGRAGRRYAIDHFSLKAAVDAYERILESVAARLSRGTIEERSLSSSAR